MNWKKLLPPILYRRGGSADKPLLDGEYIENSMEKSPALIVLVAVLVWVTAAVLLTLSDSRQRDLTVWADEQYAPFSVRARCNFSYEDVTATEQKRQEARAKELPIYRVDAKKQQQLNTLFHEFIAVLKQREKAAQAKQKFIPETRTPCADFVAGLYDFDEIIKAVNKHSGKWQEACNAILRQGIAGSDAKLPENLKKLHLISADGREYQLMPDDSKQSAEKLADALQLEHGVRGEFILGFQPLLAAGTIVYDEKATTDAREKAAATVAPVVKEKKRGEVLIERNQIITQENVAMLKAERETLPPGFGAAEFYQRIGVCFVIMMMSLFFLYRMYPKIFRSTRKFALGGAVIIIASLANYSALQLFFYFFRSGVMHRYDLMLFMIPVPLGAALISVLLGNRAALFGNVLVASLTAMMILPDRSFELMLRWFAIAALMSLLLRDVTDYRSFFVRVFFGSALLTALINSDVWIAYRDAGVWKAALLALFGNAFCCATGGLLLVFAFELIFNAETNMSLMVLCDYNHPLLEKLKREAPGTMFHSMTVATLAEDAAKAIKANPLRAKAAALFHDIGKLAMPQYFVENNVDSPNTHLAMPPQRSCGIIRGHVKEGLALARQYRLNSFIRSAILSHHGDDLISFFYQRALKERENNPDSSPVVESMFRYDGMPPQEKELTILSLADACEAASRSLNKPTPAKVEALVGDIFVGRLRGGQLRNSDLTLEELSLVKECFIADLISFNHGRIAYQQEKKDDPIALPVAKSPAPGTPEK